MKLGVTRERAGDGERDAEHLADGIFVFGSIEATKQSSAGAIMFSKRFFEPCDDCLPVLWRGLIFLFWRHVASREDIERLRPANGAMGIGPVNFDKVEIDVSFFRSFVVAIEAILDEELVDLFRDGSDIGVGRRDDREEYDEAGEAGVHLF